LKNSINNSTNKLCGVYKITCLVNNKIYIGSSIDIDYRWKQHLYYLKGKYHYNPYLQRSFNKYGVDNFKFEIIELTEEKDRLEKESSYIVKLNSVAPLGFNFTSITSPGFRGRKHTKQAKLKLRLATLGRRMPSQSRDCIHKVPLIEHGYSVEESKKLGRFFAKPFKIIDPDGKLIEGVGIRRFCAKNNLNMTCIGKIKRRLQNFHRGWTLPESERT
jgi:group I intron endonuclease